MFPLKRQEVKILVSQNVIPSIRQLGGYLPYVFTEQGVAMLSSVLKSKAAIRVNIHIMRVFVKLRTMILSNEDLRRKVEEMENKYDKQFAFVFEAIKQLLEPPKQTHAIGFHV
jgi:hypothetical protein